MARPIEAVEEIDEDNRLEKLWQKAAEAINAPEETPALDPAEQERRAKIGPLANDVLGQLQRAPTLPANGIDSVQPIHGPMAQVLKKAAENFETQAEERIANATTEELIDMAKEPVNLDDVATQAAEELGFPNLGAGVLDLGSKLEEHHSNKLSALRQEVDGHRQSMKQLLDLKGHLRPLSEDDESNALPEPAKTLILDLRKQGLDLLPKNEALDKITRKELKDLKDLIDTEKDTLQAKIQDILTTKVSMVVNWLNIFASVMQKAADLHGRLMNKITDQMIAR